MKNHYIYHINLKLFHTGSAVYSYGEMHVRPTN